MTLPSRQRAQNLSPGGLKPSALPLSLAEATQNVESLRASWEETGKKHFVSLKL